MKVCEKTRSQSSYFCCNSRREKEKEKVEIYVKKSIIDKWPSQHKTRRYMHLYTLVIKNIKNDTQQSPIHKIRFYTAFKTLAWFFGRWKSLLY